MQLACNHRDWAEIVELLIRKGASVNAHDSEGFTPLMVCARKNHIQSLCVLLQCGASVSATSRLGHWVTGRAKNEAYALRGNTALHLAAMENHENCIHQLTVHGADIWSSNNKGENLLMLAAAKGLCNTVRMCLKQGTPDQINKLDRHGNNAVIHACKNSQINSLILLLKNVHCLRHINDTSIKLNMSPLMLGVNYRCLEIVRLLLDKGANPNSENWIGATCLTMAVGKNPRDHTKEPPPCRQYFEDNPDFLSFVVPLLQKGAEVNHVCCQTGETALTLAAKNGVHSSIVEELVKQGASVNHVDRNGNTALLGACEKGKEKVIKLLLSHGASVTETCLLTGKSPLTVAVDSGVATPIVDMLLKSGVDVNHVDNDGNTALLSACKKSSNKTAFLMIQHGADVNRLSKRTGDSALTLAVENRASLELVQELLKNGAVVNHANSNNNTALYNACQNSQEEVVKWLLEHGATANHVCKVMGKTALTLAVANHFSTEVTEQLLKQGANVNHADMNGNTALKIACRDGLDEKIKCLLKNGASVAENPMPSVYGLSRVKRNFIQKLLELAGLKIDQEQRTDKDDEGVVPQLYGLCRIPARLHVMNSFPNSNLFFTIPRLVLPQKMKNFLLYNYNIDNSDDDQIPDMNIQGGKYC